MGQYSFTASVGRLSQLGSESSAGVTVWLSTASCFLSGSRVQPETRGTQHVDERQQGHFRSAGLARLRTPNATEK